MSPSVATGRVPRTRRRPARPRCRSTGCTSAPGCRPTPSDFPASLTPDTHGDAARRPTPDPGRQPVEGGPDDAQVAAPQSVERARPDAGDPPQQDDVAGPGQR